MPYDFELPEDLADNVTVEYIEDEEFDNLEEATEDEMEELPEDKAEHTFKQHKESVFTVTVNSSGTLVASGGEDDMGYLWEAGSGKVVLECSGHKDSVTQVKFSNDDKYLATGDMSGLIQVWDVAERKLVWCHESDDIEWLQWHNSAYVLICGLSSGEIYMFKIPQGNLKTLPTNGSRCNCGVLLSNGTQIAAGYDDGSVRIWDLKTTAMVSQNNNVDNGSVTNLYLSTDGKLMIACGLKSAAFILKTNDCKIVTSFKTDENDEIEAAAFCPEPDLSIVATGSLNGNVCLWDVSRQVLRHKIPVHSAITKMCWGKNALLFIAAVDGVVYILNGRNGMMVGQLTGHMTAILDFQVNKLSTFVVTCSDDQTCKVFDVEKNISVNG